MGLEALRDLVPDFAKDTRLNLGSVLSEAGAPGLSKEQIWQVALSAALATKNSRVITHIKEEVQTMLSDVQITAAESATSIMAMNNVYYRSIHLIHDDELSKLPAKLRMNVIGSPGIPKVDFEGMCLGVSAINGCGMCLESHFKELKKHGMTIEGLQSILRIASVVNAAAQSV